MVLSSGPCVAFPHVTVVKPHPRRLPACRRWLVLCRSASEGQALGSRAVPFPPRPRLPCVPPSPVTDTHAHASFTLVTPGPSVSGKSYITQVDAGVGLEQERREASGCSPFQKASVCTDQHLAWGSCYRADSDSVVAIERDLKFCISDGLPDAAAAGLPGSSRSGALSCALRRGSPVTHGFRKSH